MDHPKIIKNKLGLTMPKLRLGINIDHVATLRNARKRDGNAHPDIIRAARESMRGGANSITVHLREDRRHILDDDVKRLRETLNIRLNLEMAATEAMKAIALRVKPQAVCLVPEKRKEVTTEGGLDAIKGGARLARIVNDLAVSGIHVSLFINPDPAQVFAAYACGAAAIELHTGHYSNLSGQRQKHELRRLRAAAKQADLLGLDVHAGHGLTYKNVGAIAKIEPIIELNIGHYLVGEAVFTGLASAVRKMRVIIDAARS
jgi:pyridoxine 5-phosphate synthase